MKSLPQLLAVLAFLTLVVFGTNSFQANEGRDYLEVWFFDVGQGDSILLNTPENQQVLVDGGPDSAVLQRLSRALPLSDKDLDLVIVTHNHSDHITGIVEVLKHYHVKEIWLSGAIHTTDIYRELLELISQKNIPIKIVKAGEIAKFSSLEGIVLSPLETQTGVLPKDQNSASIVTFWQYGQQIIMLTGDMGISEEAELIKRGVVKPTTILKVGHQGSKTSSSESFLRALQPQLAVISVGAKNRYGHPHQEVLEKFSTLHIPLLRTDQDGTVKFKIWPDRFEHSTLK